MGAGEQPRVAVAAGLGHDAHRELHPRARHESRPQGQRQAGIRAGADAYLTKPFSPRELLQVVARML